METYLGNYVIQNLKFRGDKSEIFNIHLTKFACFFFQLTCVLFIHNALFCVTI